MSDIDFEIIRNVLKAGREKPIHPYTLETAMDALTRISDRMLALALTALKEKSR